VVPDSCPNSFHREWVEVIYSWSPCCPILLSWSELTMDVLCPVS